MAGVKISICKADTSAKQEAVTTADGKFNLSLSEGQYIMRMEKTGFPSTFSTFNVQPDSKLSLDFTVANSSIVPLNPQPKHLRVGGKVAESNLTVKVPPVYPASAKQAHIQGTVKLDLTITQEGVPQDLRVVSSPSDDLSESALEAVQQWRYRPVLLNGQPVEIETIVVVNYTLAP